MRARSSTDARPPSATASTYHSAWLGSLRIDGFNARRLRHALDGGRTSARVCAGAVDEAGGTAAAGRRVGQPCSSASHGSEAIAAATVPTSSASAPSSSTSRRVEAAQLVEIRQAEAPSAATGSTATHASRTSTTSRPPRSAYRAPRRPRSPRGRAGSAGGGGGPRGRRGDGGVGETAPLDCARAWTALSRSACSGPM